MAGKPRFGGILRLLELIEEHTSAIAYDFRTRFHVSYMDVGTSRMPYREALHLVEVLTKDPSSWLQAGVSGWAHPASREWFLSADLYDLERAKAPGRRAKPYARPNDVSQTRIGGTRKVRRTPEEYRAWLARPRVEKK